MIPTPTRPRAATLACACAVALLAAGCSPSPRPLDATGDATPAPASAPVPQPVSAQGFAPRDPAQATASEARGVLAPDAIDIAPPAAFDRFPALAAAARAAADRRRAAFESAAREAAARGEDVSGWRLALRWRVLMGNRYLRIAEGTGEERRGASVAPVVERITYEGIGKAVLGLGDWFADDAAWPVLRERAYAVLQADLARKPAGDARDNASLQAQQGTEEIGPATAYAPVFTADGPVMAFDLLFAPGVVAAPAEGVRTVRVPLPDVQALVAPERRPLLTADAAGP